MLFTVGSSSDLPLELLLPSATHTYACLPCPADAIVQAPIRKQPLAKIGTC